MSIDKTRFIDLLNADLANEYQAVLMYTTYAARVAGPHRPALRTFFQSEIPEELAHAQFLADKIVSLGGVPTVKPSEVPNVARPREMLEAVLAAEQKAIASYKERAEQAAALGDKGLATHLETMIEDETSHFEETSKILRGWE